MYHGAVELSATPSVSLPHPSKPSKNYVSLYLRGPAQSTRGRGSPANALRHSKSATLEHRVAAPRASPLSQRRWKEGDPGSPNPSPATMAKPGDGLRDACRGRAGSGRADEARGAESEVSKVAQTLAIWSSALRAPLQSQTGAFERGGQGLSNSVARDHGQARRAAILAAKVRGRRVEKDLIRTSKIAARNLASAA
jgi:hypothetical protein